MSTSAITFCGNIYPRPCSHHVRRWAHGQTVGSAAPWATRAFCHHPQHTAVETRFRQIFQHFKDRSAYGCGSFCCLSGFAQRDRDSQHVGFPQLFSDIPRAEVFIFAKLNLKPGECIWRKCLPCSPWPPPLLSEAPCPPVHGRSIGRARNYSSGAGRNTTPRGNGNSWQTPSPVLRYVSSALRLS